MRTFTSSFQRFVRVVGATVALLFVGFVGAQACTLEIEPNNEPHLSTPVGLRGPESAVPPHGRMGSLCVTGELTADDQDMFVWRVDEEMAKHRWRIEFSGIGADNLTRLDLVQLTFLDDGVGVTSRSDILTLQSYSTLPVHSNEFMLAPGNYYIGFSKSGGTGVYSAILRTIDNLSNRHYNIGQYDLVGNEQVFGFIDGETIQRWSVAPEHNNMLWRFRLESGLAASATLEIRGPNGTVAEVTTDKRHAVLDNLQLGAGQYDLVITGTPGPVRLEIDQRGQATDGVEVEPNNSRSTANQFPLFSEMRGTATDVDWFRIDVPTEAAGQPVTFTATAGEELTIIFEQEGGKELFSRRATDIEVANLHLSAGSYFVQVQGRAITEYTLATRPGTAPAPGFEQEPNDHYTWATPVADDGQIRGELSGDRDIDVFSFEVVGTSQLHRVQIMGRERLQAEILDGDGRSVASVWNESRIRFDNLALNPGTYFVQLTRGNGEYSVRILPLGPAPEPDVSDIPAADEPLVAAKAVPAEPTSDPLEQPLEPLPDPPAGELEREPNNDRTRANYLTPGVPRVGTLPSIRDTDVYRFHLAEDMAVRVELIPPAGSETIRYRLDDFRSRDVAEDAEQHDEYWLLAGDHYIEVTGGPTNDGWYQLRLTYLNPAEFAALNVIPEAPQMLEREPFGSLPLDITLDSEAEFVAAYWHHGQRTELKARVTNRGSETLAAAFSAYAGDAQVQLHYNTGIQVAPGETVTVPITVEIPTDMRDDVPLSIWVAAEHNNLVSGARHDILASCDALPVGAFDWWPLPAGAVGRIDMLHEGLGAMVSPATTNSARSELLIDGLATIATSGRVPREDEDLAIGTFSLAGDEPTRLVGAVLHPLGHLGRERQLKDFRIETSLDGERFTEVFTGRMKAAVVDQTFMFPEPVLARHVRIIGLNNQGHSTSWIGLGEFSVLAEDLAPFGQLDIANPNLGGHVVWSSPHIGTDWINVERKHPTTVDLRGRKEFEMVFGFQNSRAAQITHIEWEQHPSEEGRYSTLPETTVWVSTQSAAGPWEQVATWELQTNPGAVTRLDFAEPIWARYVRFSQPTVPDEGHFAVPSAVRIFEREADGEYLSIVGLWGNASPYAIYERLQPSAQRAVVQANLVNNTMETAMPLTDVAEGTVLVNEAQAWYKATIGPGENHMRITFTGEPLIQYEYRVVDANGNPVPYDVVHKRNDEVVIGFYSDPGDYYVHVYENKRSIIVAWDTSRSMGPYLETTYAALDSFVRDIDGTTEFAQLLAYNDPLPTWVMPFWTDSNEQLSRAMNSYDRNDHSSSSETALLIAMDALEQRPGTRAILLITDAETTSYGYTEDVWRMMAEVDPYIFSFEVNSYGTKFGQRLMQDWGISSGAFYDNATQIGDLDMGYRRALCFLRREKQYRIEVETSAAALPGPGSLAVVRPEDAPTPAVEVIFDASGSMGVDLPSGEQRIRAAKQTMEHLITNVLPEGTPFALRAFGHVEPVTCNMALEVPLGPLDQQQALAAVRGIELKLLSQTPLAEAILATEEDLAEASRERTIILITDGEESCGGDPVAAVKQLQSRYDLNLAIISLGIDSSEVAAFEALASRTGVSYVDVGSMAELQNSVVAALNPTYDVFNVAGEVVASGVVDGDAIELEMGVYTVRITSGGPPIEFPDVRVPGERSVTLTLRAP